ncbi:MAG TPA: 2-oxoacid:acceptor oxidoreductase subunit alpha [Thermoplasmata archaeon]|nr:2-oxoacid:acceptor oxidoreductase subunit alpha [Thermoplasmata archaeon]
MTTPATQTSIRAAETSPAQRRATQELTDVSVIVGGQGGDGTLTVVDLLGRYFRKRGLYVYTSRNTLSRIRGGHADASVRACRDPRAAIKAKADLLLAFDQEAIEVVRSELAPDALVLYDSTSFKADFPDSLGFPFATLTGSQLGQPIYKNTAAYGAIAVLMGFEDAIVRQVIEERFKRRGAEALDKNLKALEIGRQAALAVPGAVNRWSLAEGDAHDLILTTGNQATALGFVVGGGRFFAGYPITPATEIMEYLMRYLPNYHGVVRQGEDELASINMVIGAATTGARAMTSTSGPGLSLMTEGIGHAGTAELGILIADCQRVGPSTGQPTRHEQSDLAHLAHLGHGEFPKFILAPGSAEDCFYLTVDALNLAEKWRLPVILLLDQALSQNASTVPGFDLSRVKVERPSLLTADQVSKQAEYKYYAFSPNGISPFAPVGTPGVTAQITGNEHDEWGHVSVNPVNRHKMMEKRMGKLIQARDELPRPRYFGRKEARIGLIGYGSTSGPILEAIDLLDAEGIATKYLQARTLFPVQQETLGPFFDSVDLAFVVEHNYTGQLARLIREEMPQYHPKLRSILKYDGFSFRAPDIADPIREASHGSKR